MTKPYEFLEGTNNYLAIKLDLEFGKKLRGLGLNKTLPKKLKKEAENIPCFNRFNFIKGSLLLESISLEGISGDSLHMTSAQREYFLGNTWKDEKSNIPGIPGFFGKIIYLPKDFIGQTENLKKLWGIYFNQIKQILR